MSESNRVDVSSLFKAEGLRRVQCTLANALATALRKSGPEMMMSFVRVARDSVTGKRAPFEHGIVAWMHLGPGRRAFRFCGRWIEARINPRTVEFDIADEEYVHERFTTEMNQLLEELEAQGVLRRAGMRNGQVAWKAGPRS